MAIQWPNPNFLIPQGRDKLGMFLLEFRRVLTESGLFVVTGSGDGLLAYENEGQTDGSGPGRWDVFANNADNPYYIGSDILGGANALNQISKATAWLQIKEVVSTRTWQIGRVYNQASYSNFSGTIYWKFCPYGVQPSGATAKKWPPPIGVSTFWGGDFTTSNWAYAYPLCPGINQDLAQDIIAQIGVTDTPRAKGVCPFFVVLANRTTQSAVGGFYYESLTDVDPSLEHPFVHRFSTTFVDTWGAVGGGNSGSFFTEGAPAGGIVGHAGDRLAPYRFDAKHSNWLGTIPGPGFVPLNASGKWDTFYPRVRTVRDGDLGRCEHLLANMVNRNYPTTYNLSGPSPRLTVGQLLLPWRADVVPSIGA